MKKSYLIIVAIVSCIMVGCNKVGNEEMRVSLNAPTTTTQISTQDLLNNDYSTVVLESWFNSLVKEEFRENPSSTINADYLDIDSGAISRIGSGDIFFRLDCGSDCFSQIETVDSIEAKKFGYSEPNYTDCLQLLSDPNIRTYTFIPSIMDYYICIRTDQGNLAWIRFGQFQHNGVTREEYGGSATVGYLELSFTLLFPNE
jgi:hypothetical protein